MVEIWKYKLVLNKVIWFYVLDLGYFYSLLFQFILLFSLFLVLFLEKYFYSIEIVKYFIFLLQEKKCMFIVNNLEIIEEY